jgi:polyisoprenoid-binding protein YceI
MKSPLFATALLALAATAHAESATYKIDPNHTFATFEIAHFGTSTNRGRWDKKEGTVTLDKAAKTGSVELTIDMASIDTGTDAFTKHLKSKDFFDVEQFPTAKFVGDKFTFEGDKVTSVAGQLTMMGKTNPVTLKAANFNCYTNPMFKREVCGGDFTATLPRSQWGITYGLQYGFPENVDLIVQVEAIKQ